ncbi:unnamed protein product [Adineta steineri]|uniref:Uncharacterized protein n=1 Tax=Adineta steineri TaxID=433720 RepID=A0A816ASJ8_9BILA|nr:unnamed protein product [Adineta steineri]CAF1601355.1 unnamed protein product [Adineta steineri]
MDLSRTKSCAGNNTLCILDADGVAAEGVRVNSVTGDVDSRLSCCHPYRCNAIGGNADDLVAKTLDATRTGADEDAQINIPDGAPLGLCGQNEKLDMQKNSPSNGASNCD